MIKRDPGPEGRLRGARPRGGLLAAGYGGARALLLLPLLRLLLLLLAARTTDAQIFIHAAGAMRTPKL